MTFLQKILDWFFKRAYKPHDLSLNFSVEAFESFVKALIKHNAEHDFVPGDALRIDFKNGSAIIINITK